MEMDSKTEAPISVANSGPEKERLMTNHQLLEVHGADTLIECQSCYRTFHTQAQFGQHSRICRGGAGTSRRFIDSKSQPFKYCYLERQSKNTLEIKSRFTVQLKSPNVIWKDVVKLNGLHDSGIAEDLKLKKLERVHVAIRHSQRSGLIVANFVIRNVAQTADTIHSAKMDIERAVDEVKGKLPTECEMKMHLCSISGCKELVIRDTEGLCSRHRAQNYHKKNARKRNQMQMEKQRLRLQLQLRCDAINNAQSQLQRTDNHTINTMNAMNINPSSMNPISSPHDMQRHLPLNLNPVSAVNTLNTLSLPMTPITVPDPHCILLQNVSAPSLLPSTEFALNGINGSSPFLSSSSILTPSLPPNELGINDTVPSIPTIPPISRLNKRRLDDPAGDPPAKRMKYAVSDELHSNSNLNASHRGSDRNSNGQNHEQNQSQNQVPVGDSCTMALNTANTALTAAAAGIATPSAVLSTDGSTQLQVPPVLNKLSASIPGSMDLSSINSINPGLLPQGLPVDLTQFSLDSNSNLGLSLNDALNVLPPSPLSTSVGDLSATLNVPGGALYHLQTDALNQFPGFGPIGTLETLGLSTNLNVANSNGTNSMQSEPVSSAPTLNCIRNALQVEDRQDPNLNHLLQTNNASKTTQSVMSNQQTEATSNALNLSVATTATNSNSCTSSTVGEESNNLKNPLSQPLSMSPLIQNRLENFLSSKLKVVNTPSVLSGVPIYQSSLRQEGMNIISVDWATQIPKPQQVLQKDVPLIVLQANLQNQGASNGANSNSGSTGSLSSAITPIHSLRIPQFCQDLTQNYIECVPTPQCLVGSTLASTPQLRDNGIHLVAVNFQVQHPQKMSNTPLKGDDILICQFTNAQDKEKQLCNALRQIHEGETAAAPIPATSS